LIEINYILTGHNLVLEDIVQILKVELLIIFQIFYLLIIQEN